MEDFVKSSTCKYLFFEVPLIHTRNLINCFNLILTIHTDKKIRVKRLCERDISTENEVEKRLAFQKNEMEYLKVCNIAFYNNSTQKDLTNEIDIFLHFLPLQRFRKRQKFW